MQRALLHGSGWVNLVLCFDRREGASDDMVREGAARLIAAAATPGLPSNLNILVGLGWKALHELPPFKEVARGVEPALLKARELDQTDHDLFVQVAAQTGVDAEIARRVIDFCLGDVFNPASVTIAGSRILNGQEHFGFPDGEAPTWDKIAAATHAAAVTAAEAFSKSKAELALPDTKAALEEFQKHLVTSGPGSWVLFQPLRQKIDAFFKQPDESRAEIIGRPPATLVDPHARGRAMAAAPLSTHSHFGTMTKPGALPLLRRGFPCRLDDGPGLAFIAATENAGVLGEALDRFFGRGSGAADPLSRYVEPKPGALFYCPPNARWLGAAAERGPWPPQIAALLHRTAPMTIYEVAQSFATYLMTLKEDGVFVGEPGKMSFEPAVKKALDAFHAAVAAVGASPKNVKTQLDQMAENAQQDANNINESAGAYVTFS